MVDYPMPVRLTMIAFLSMPMMATAQDVRTGRVAQSSVGRAGEREPREGLAGVTPAARIQNRIQNRVPARLATRIDRYYSPQSGATSSFAAAEDRARMTGMGGKAITRPRR
jgi:hypothetical protein